ARASSPATSRTSTSRSTRTTAAERGAGAPRGSSMAHDALLELDPAAAADAQALIGRSLGEFVVREPLSSGGFGVVFRAEQPALAREAVIKVMHTRHRASENLIQRFLREARLASRLDHPYAAHIYAFGAEPDGVLWIAMEL